MPKYFWGGGNLPQVMRFLPSYKQRLRGEGWAEIIVVLECTEYKSLGSVVWVLAEIMQPSGQGVCRTPLHTQLPDFWTLPGGTRT